MLGPVKAAPVPAPGAGSLDGSCARWVRGGALAREGLNGGYSLMTLEIYPVVLELVQRTGPLLPSLRSC